YRLHGQKGNSTIPLLIAPEIIDEYAEPVVDTLHKKNLLLLGEDRFLSTLMLRSFPKRKMVFVPQAVCRTVVPDEFKVLLSQRRRWINSTIHNLMQLVQIRELCGTFCFSMRFVVALELFGTAVMPAALIFMFILLISPIFTGRVESTPLILLVLMLGLPGFLIMITTRKFIYVSWMFIYILAMPIWNFVLPIYAFWHFDDFSWGETRKVEGEVVGGGHGHGDDNTNEFDQTDVPRKRFDEWERMRLNKTSYRTDSEQTISTETSFYELVANVNYNTVINPPDQIIPYIPPSIIEKDKNASDEISNKSMSMSEIGREMQKELKKMDFLQNPPPLPPKKNLKPKKDETTTTSISEPIIVKDKGKKPMGSMNENIEDISNKIEFSELQNGNKIQTENSQQSLIKAQKKKRTRAPLPQICDENEKGVESKSTDETFELQKLEELKILGTTNFRVPEAPKVPSRKVYQPNNQNKPPKIPTFESSTEIQTLNAPANAKTTRNLKIETPKISFGREQFAHQEPPFLTQNYSEFSQPYSAGTSISYPYPYPYPQQFYSYHPPSVQQFDPSMMNGFVDNQQTSETESLRSYMPPQSYPSSVQTFHSLQGGPETGSWGYYPPKQEDTVSVQSFHSFQSGFHPHFYAQSQFGNTDESGTHKVEFNR
ncbi:Chitin synthase, class 3, partial [Nowakowskiella sp. JEL0078]